MPICKDCKHAQGYTQGVVLESWCELNRRRINPNWKKAPVWCPLQEEADNETSD